ncbi:MAG: AraC family transcriptional regulator [Acutalibacteraceae bacterium]|nr:AraC family transcriptional regulator [Acutalibacteraceae bacterium]
MFEEIKWISSGKFVSRGEWIHPDRIIDSYEIIFVIKGTVYIDENGTKHKLEKNDILLLEPHLRHFGYKTSENTSFYWLHYSANNFKLELKHTHIEKPYNLSLLFSQLLHYRADTLFPETLDYITRLIVSEIYPDDTQPKESRMINNIAQWINANSDTIIRVSNIAKHFGYNVDYLSRLFKKHYKKSLKEYIDETKIEYIKNQLLNSNASLKEIAAACGFSEYKYFLKFFTYHEKMTPTEFCNTYSKSHINNR